MSTSVQNRYPGSPSIHDAVHLFRLVRRRWIVFIALLLILFLSMSYYYRKHTYYEGRITFLVNAGNFAEMLWDAKKENIIEFSEDDKTTNRIAQIVFSNQMFDYLISQFDLYQHYRIPKNSPDSYLHVTGLLHKNISLQIGKYKIITIKVSDRYDYNVAANIANGIGKKVNEINRKITLDYMARKTELFESLSKDLKKSTQKELSRIDSSLASMKALFNAGNVRDPYFVSYINDNMDNLQGLMGKYYDDLFDSYKMKLYSMYSFQDKNLPGVTILEKALSDERSKTKNDWFMYPLIFMLSAMICFFVFYMYLKAGGILGYVWSQSRFEPGLDQE